MRKYWENPAPERDNARAGLPALVPGEVRFGDLRIAPATVLAPMAGVTDTVFRRFIRNLGGCGLLETEFTSADGLFRMRESKRTRYLHYYEDERPISAQLFGSNPYTLSESAKIVEETGFDVVDLNLGCPAKKVVKCNGGSGLLRDLPLIETIFKQVRAAVKIPFTVKFRMGWNDDDIVCVELAKLAERCGLQAVALHARTREQGYSGNARWEWIAAVKDAIKIPVVGNGDIRSPEDAVAMIAQTGCDAVMIGRTAASNPWIFRQIAQYTAAQKAGHLEDKSRAGKLYDSPTDRDRYDMIRTYFEMLVEEEMHGTEGKMKQFVTWFTHSVPNSGGLRKAVYTAKSGPEILRQVNEFFEEHLSGKKPAESEPMEAAAELSEISCD